MRVRYFFGALLSFILLACDQEPKPEPVPQAEAEIQLPFHADYDLNSLGAAAGFAAKGEGRGQFTDLSEVSGLAASRANPEYLWVHEDSGNLNELYLISKNNPKIVVTYKIDGVTNIDWEDISIGPGPLEGVNYLYIADIGDNSKSRNNLAIYRIPEPGYSAADSSKSLSVTDLEKIAISYPDSAHDAEALMVDPATKDLYIITKGEPRNLVYRLGYQHSTTGNNTLELVGSFPFNQTVAADISEDGRKVLIKTYFAIYYWEMKNDRPLVNLLAEKPKKAPYDPVEIQGESICWDGGSYFTLSEKFASFIPRLYFYEGN